MTTVHVATLNALDPTTLYGILRLRVEVFMLEQNSLYPDLDGRDTEPTTRHVWAADDSGAILGYLRVLEEPDGQARIGRVVVAAAGRGKGLASSLMTTALEIIGERSSVLAAQIHLAEFYGRFGYEPIGEPFQDGGIPHLPMRRTAPTA